VKDLLKRKCTDCYERNICRDSAGAWVFLLIGIVATVSGAFSAY